MNCRKGCGACCIFISISSPLPQHPNGKAAGVPCKNLKSDKTCSLWNTPEYPRVCGGCKAEPVFCGDTFEEAKEILTDLEKS